jgi:hypothetical protein
MEIASNCFLDESDEHYVVVHPNDVKDDYPMTLRIGRLRIFMNRKAAESLIASLESGVRRMIGEERR